MLTFSISIPIGAYHQLLPTCLASLASQGEGLQIALLDASNDPRVKALADRYDGMLAYRRHGPDGGQSAAIIEGWNNTDGEILGWLNADDFLFPNAIERARREFQSDARTDVVAGHSAICDEQGRMTGYHWSVEPPGENLRSGCVISQPSCFFRRSAYQKAGGLDEALHYTMDWDLWLRLLSSGAEFRFVDEILSAVYWGEGTKTLGMKPARRRELMRLIETYTPDNLKFRAKRGFYLRAALDEIRPPSLSRFLESKLRRRTPFIFGIGPQGRLAAQSKIFWMHYDESPRNALAIRIDSADAVTVDAVGRPAEVVRNGGALQLQFQNPVAAGELVDLSLSIPAGASARLLSCDWV